MNRDEVADLCESLPGAWPDSPWGEDDLVYKLGNRNAEGKGGKIFCFVGGGTTEGQPHAISPHPRSSPRSPAVRSRDLPQLPEQVSLGRDHAGIGPPDPNSKS